MYNIEFSSRALNNIDDIKEYIARDNVIIAEKVISSILNISNHLSFFPEMWQIKKLDLREFVEPIYKYIIRYKIKNHTVYIVTIYKFKNEI